MSSGTTAAPRPTSLRLWRAGDAKLRLLGTALVALMATVLALAIAAQASGPIYGDFFAMWTFARFGLTHPVAGIYDPAALHAFQVSVDPSFAGHAPFPYPPTYLLPLLVIGLLPIAAGWAVWSLLGFGGFVCACLARRFGSTEVLFTALAPATVMSLITGQNGLIGASLMVGGVRLMASRPAVAGVMFGLMSFKPQLGLLVPLALVAAGLWRCFGVATATTLALAAAASAAFGLSIWGVWWRALWVHYDDYVVVGNRVRGKMPTITANLELLGVGPHVAEAAQLAVGAGVAALVCLALRRRGPDRLAVAALLVGNFLVTPYSLFYDMPPVTFALLLLLRDSLGRGGALSLGEVLVALFAFLMPYEQFAAGLLPVPLAGTALLLLFAVLMRRALVPTARLS